MSEDARASKYDLICMIIKGVVGAQGVALFVFGDDHRSDFSLQLDMPPERAAVAKALVGSALRATADALAAEAAGEAVDAEDVANVIMHQSLDRLMAEWIAEGGTKELRLPSECTVLELAQWSAARLKP